LGNFNRKNLVYVDGHPCQNIGSFINICRCSLFNANCSFEEDFNGKELFMKKKAFKFVVVPKIQILSLGDKLLMDYNFHRQPTNLQRWLAFKLLLDTPLGHVINNIE